MTLNIDSMRAILAVVESSESVARTGTCNIFHLIELVLLISEIFCGNSYLTFGSALTTADVIATNNAAATTYTNVCPPCSY